MPQGTVKFFNEMKGYGFITPDGGGQDAFVHISAVEQAGLRTLNNDQRVEFELSPDKRGRESATNLKAYPILCCLLQGLHPVQTGAGTGDRGCLLASGKEVELQFRACRPIVAAIAERRNVVQL